MKFINTKMHGILDYVMGVLFIVSPWAFDFYKAGNETWLMLALGGATILFSLFTNYEFGLVRKIPMSYHLMIDFTVGLLIATSPWLFGFHKEVYLPHIILGALEMFVVMCSSSDAFEKANVPAYPSKNE